MNPLQSIIRISVLSVGCMFLATGCVTSYTGSQFANNITPLPDAVDLSPEGAQARSSIEAFASVSTTWLRTNSEEFEDPGYNDLHANAGLTVSKGIKISDNFFLGGALAASGFYSSITNDTETTLSEADFSGSAWGGTLQTDASFSITSKQALLRYFAGPSAIISFDRGQWFDKRKAIAADEDATEYDYVQNISPNGIQAGFGLHNGVCVSPSDRISLSLGIRSYSMEHNPFSSESERNTLMHWYFSVEADRARVWVHNAYAFDMFRILGNTSKNTWGIGVAFRIR